MALAMTIDGPGNGFGATDQELDQIVKRLMVTGFQSDIEGALKSLTGPDRQRLVEKLLAAGANPSVVDRAVRAVNRPIPSRTLAIAWGLLGTASMAASAYHGYKRNRSVGWALVWGFFGALAPVITPTIAVAQGFGKRKGS